jgi:ADP-ribose pyrophosphatase YjhB (NUDIX family)
MESVRMSDATAGSHQPAQEDSRRYPARPVVGVGGIVIDEGKVLLVRRGREPLKGYWSIPGGAVNTGEPLEAALRRELQEETGLPVEPLFLVAVFERLMPDASGNTEYHYVLIDYVCGIAGDVEPADARPGDDADEVGWFALDEAETMLMTPGTFDVVAKALLAWDAWRTHDGDPRAGLYLNVDTVAERSAEGSAQEGECRT